METDEQLTDSRRFQNEKDKETACFSNGCNHDS